MPLLAAPRTRILKDKHPAFNSGPFILGYGTPQDREQIFRIRHEIYAEEIQQHPLNQEGRLQDPLDENNHYLVAKQAGELCGFISISAPGQYSLLKYFSQPPLDLDDDTYEIRLLSVRKPFRNSEVALLLTYAAFRWVQARGGRQIVAIGRREVMNFYERIGLKRVGLSTNSGAVIYDLMRCGVEDLARHIGSLVSLKQRLRQKCSWKFSFDFEQPARCFHGGEFFSAIGPCFDSLERSETVINADVLDAWFEPAPEVLQAIQQHLPWLARTSPPTACEGFLQVVAEARKVTPKNILPGSGSSDLIFRALRHWLHPTSKVLLLDPTYGEYLHVLEKVIGCRVDRLRLMRQSAYEVDLGQLQAALEKDYDLIILVNPNSPTGRPIWRTCLEPLLKKSRSGTRVWIDETYIDYLGGAESMERYAARSENVIVCKSMSKVYALSGMRVAYLCAGAHQLEGLRAITPPWVVSLPAQVAAVEALRSSEYYQACYAQTHALRKQLADGLRGLGWEVIPGCANFLLCHLPEQAPTASEIVAACKKQGLYLRDAAGMGSSLGPRVLRLAVKDARTQRRMIEIIESTLKDLISRSVPVIGG